MKILCACLAVAAAVACSAPAYANPLIYAAPGVENPATYSFTALQTGDITAYFTGSTAAYQNALTLLVNGQATGTVGLNSTSPYGSILNFGSVNAGDSLVFELVNINPGNIGPWFTDKSMNSDGVQHIYSTTYGGDAIVPGGIYIAFEDLPNGGNLNYNDETFVFRNVALITGTVPEPTSIALLLIGAAGLGYGRRRAHARASRGA